MTDQLAKEGSEVTMIEPETCCGVQFSYTKGMVGIGLICLNPKRGETLKDLGRQK